MIAFLIFALKYWLILSLAVAVGFLVKLHEDERNPDA